MRVSPKYKCEVRLDDMVVAAWGVFDCVADAMIELAESSYAVDLPLALFAVVQLEDGDDVCVTDAKGLTTLRQLERERWEKH